MSDARSICLSLLSTRVTFGRQSVLLIGRSPLSPALCDSQADALNPIATKSTHNRPFTKRRVRRFPRTVAEQVATSVTKLVFHSLKY